MALFDKVTYDKTTGVYSHTKTIVQTNYVELPASPWNVFKMGVYNFFQPNPLKRLQFVDYSGNAKRGNKDAEPTQ